MIFQVLLCDLGANLPMNSMVTDKHGYIVHNGGNFDNIHYSLVELFPVKYFLRILQNIERMLPAMLSRSWKILYPILLTLGSRLVQILAREITGFDKLLLRQHKNTSD
jgi:hypothetical protein